MDEFGNISPPWVSKDNMNQNLYKTECIPKRLIPFIRKHHNINDILFWPDMSRIHYADYVTAYYESAGIDYVTWKQNAKTKFECDFEF